MAYKAFAIYHADFDMTVIYIAATRGKAHAAAFNACREAGYKAKWGDFKTKRAARFDGIASPGRYQAGYVEKGRDLWGNFCGYNAHGCMEGMENDPYLVYKGI